MYELKPLEADITCFLDQDFTGECYGIYISNLGVTEQARKKGVGALLINQVLKAIEGFSNVKYMYLDVMVNNLPAIKLDEKMKFVKLFPKIEYYGEDSDGYLYCRNLSENKENELIDKFEGLNL